MDILDAIGNTSIIRLRKFAPPDCAEIWVKLESENPTGSMKDRMALAVISRAEQDGRLKPGDTIVAAIQVAERLGQSARGVTLLVDSGLKYLSTDVYRSRL